MAETPENNVVRLSDMTRALDFALKPDGDSRAALAGELGVSKIRKLTLIGRLTPEGKRDWRLEADLGATVVQPCVVTLEPVTTRIDETVTRRYLADMPDLSDLTEAEAEMPEDDTAEPLPATLDLQAVMAEALSLALPDFPRADGVAPVEASAVPPGADPLEEADVKPFAALKALRDKMGGTED